MKSFVVLCLLLSLSVGRFTSAEESELTAGSSACIIGCVMGACREGALACALCIGKCLVTVQASPMDMSHLNNRYFCNLGCAASVCTKLHTDKYPDEKRVKGCVNSCSQSCSSTKN